MKRLARLLEIPFMLVGLFFTWFGPFLHELGAMALFGGKVILHVPRRPFEWGELIVQLYHVGVKSLPIVALAGFFIGAVVAVQFNYAMGLFGATQYLGGMTTSALLREVGPAVIAVMIAGRIGAFVTAELGTMKATEQLDAVRAGGFWSIYPNVEIGYFTLFGKSYPYYKPFKPVL